LPSSNSYSVLERMTAVCLSKDWASTAIFPEMQ
jgi:hypothetical protein